jgi:plastocyanin
MRHRLAILTALATLGVFALPALAQRVHSRTIKVGDFYFVKDIDHTPTVHVAKGALVRWRFVGTEDHNVTVESGPTRFHSRDMNHGVYKRKLTRTGTYLIECTIHGFKMRLVVGKPKVEQQPAPQPPAPNPYGY